MSNVIFGFDNRTDVAMLQGGSWQSTLPLTNLQTREYGTVARTTDLALASTVIEFDLTSLEQIRALALINHNGSLDAQYRLTLSEASDYSSPVYAGTYTDFWPGVYATTDLDFEAENWWSGQYLIREINATKPLLPIILPSTVWARFGRLEIFDTGNQDGYFQAGRMFIGRTWQPRVNIIGGTGIGIVTDTTSEKAVSGALYFDRKVSKRVMRGTIDSMTDDEAMSNPFELMRQMGTDGEILVRWDPDDTVNALRRTFVAHLLDPSLVEYPWHDRGVWPFSFEELV